MLYPFQSIESKWQSLWDEKQCFRAEIDPGRPKYYALDMFPYPSGHGLHVGHLASYTPTDVLARFKRTTGFNVLHPMGYDAFGLPAEQYAIQTGIHPSKTTDKAIANFRRQFNNFGFSMDWSRELSTCDPKFYKWTQKIFLILHERGLAYQKEVPVNWCPALRTVLANEEVVDGKSERGNHPVIRKKMKQWMLKITDYAERLIDDLEGLDWPNATIQAQKNWIGRSVGAEVHFRVEGTDQPLTVFTTRPDTLFGVTYMALAPESPWVDVFCSPEQREQVDEYVEQSTHKSELDRKSDLEKTGVFTGGFVQHPITQQKIPVWVADYVLMEYGTGAIMAVPGHDQRDFEFAEKFSLPITRVLASDEDLPFMGDGLLVNSDFLDGLNKVDAIKKMIEHLEKEGQGQGKVQYKLRDWLFSRQRYWGEPFPIIHYENGQSLGVADDELPVTLPEVADYEPTEQGEPPLARVPEWVNYIHPKTGEKGQRDTDTMPGWAGSSWYFSRFIDPHNENEPYSKEADKYWMPVDLYVGGKEHSTLHLLYARFWQKVLFDAGVTQHKEPFQKLRHQGVVMGPDGQRMSKSRGNVVNPDEVRNQFGSDCCRLYICFMGPFEKDKPWDSQGIEGIKRFLERVWRLVVDENDQLVVQKDVPGDSDLQRAYHRTLKKVGEDIESLNLNTAISAMMILVNELYKKNVRPKSICKGLVQMLAPFAPHLSEELWEKLGGEGFVSLAPWPEYDPSLTTFEVITMGVQVNGKMRGTIELAPDADEETALGLANEVTSVQKALDEKKIVKVIYRAGRILNLIAK